MTIGDPIPAAVAGYYDALDAGRRADVLACFAATGRLAVPPADAPRETSPRLVVQGREAIGAWYDGRPWFPMRHVIDLCVCDGPACLVEGIVEREGTPIAGFAASFRLDDDGLLARYLVFAGRPAPDPRAHELAPVEAPTDAFAVFDRYLTALQDGRLDDAVGHFGADALYAHPPFVHRPGGLRTAWRGRAEIAAGFGERGPAPFRHDVVAGGQRGAHALLEGRTRDLPDGRSGSFVSAVSVDGDGRIARYVSYYTEPAVD